MISFSVQRPCVLHSLTACNYIVLYTQQYLLYGYGSYVTARHPGFKSHSCQFFPFSPFFLSRLNSSTNVNKYLPNLLLCMTTVEPPYDGHFGTLILVLITEVSSIQRSLDTPQYYTGTENGVLIIEVSAIQRFVIERFHCT